MEHLKEVHYGIRIRGAVDGCGPQEIYPDQEDSRR